MDIMRLAGKICGRVLRKNYAFYKKLISEYIIAFLFEKTAIQLNFLVIGGVVTTTSGKGCFYS